MSEKNIDVWEEFSTAGVDTMVASKTGLSLDQAERKFNGVAQAAFATLMNLKECRAEQHKFIQTSPGADPTCPKCTSSLDWASIKDYVEEQLRAKEGKITKNAMSTIIAQASNAEREGVPLDVDLLRRLRETIPSFWGGRSPSDILDGLGVDSKTEFYKAVGQGNYGGSAQKKQTLTDATKATSKATNKIADLSRLLIKLRLSVKSYGTGAANKDIKDRAEAAILKAEGELEAAKVALTTASQTIIPEK